MPKMPSVDRIGHGQLQTAKVYWRRLIKSHKHILHNSREQDVAKSFRFCSLKDLNPDPESKSKSKYNKTSTAGTALIPLTSSTPLLLEEFLRERRRFTLSDPVRDAPKYRNIGILELDDKWKYWIPTKRVKTSLEDIIVSSPSTEECTVIPLPSHAPSSFNKREFLKCCKTVVFGREQIVFHESRKLPKEVKGSLTHLHDAQDVREQIEQHLTPLYSRPQDRSQSLGSFTSDPILLFSANGTEKPSPHYEFTPGKRCSPGRVSEVSNLITTQIHNLGSYGTKDDFSFLDAQVKFVYDMPLREKQRVLARGRKGYQCVWTSFRLWLLGSKQDVVANVLRLTPEHEKGKVSVRWRVKMLSVFSVFVPPTMRRHNYLDFYSEFHLNEAGLVSVHILSKVTPAKSGLEVSALNSPSKKVTAAAAAATLLSSSTSADGSGQAC